MVKFNPFPDAKKGIRRMIQKKPMTKKTTSWSSVPYVKDNKGVAARFRLRQTKWRRTIQELVTASDEEIISILIKDQLLRDWKGAMCPHCQSGKLSALTNNGRDDILRHRCNCKGCQRYLLPQHLHPIFSATKGPEGHTLQMQAAALLVRLLHVPLSAIHVLTHINHKALEKNEPEPHDHTEGLCAEGGEKHRFWRCSSVMERCRGRRSHVRQKGPSSP